MTQPDDHRTPHDAEKARRAAEDARDLAWLKDWWWVVALVLVVVFWGRIAAALPEPVADFLGGLRDVVPTFLPGS